MVEKFKYTSRRQNIYIGVGFICVGITFLILFIMFIGRGNNLVKILCLLTATLELFIGICYMTLCKRNYVVIKSDEIEIDDGLGLFIPAYRVKFKNIKIIKTIGNEIRIVKNSEREYRIKMDCLILNDIERIKSLLDMMVVKR